MKIAISGGTGFFGQRFIDRYADKFDEIIVLTRNPTKYQNSNNVKFVGWDTDKLSGWEKSLEGMDCVINLAGENLAGEGFFPERWTETKRKKILESRRKSGNILAEAINHLENPPSKFLQASAIGYYGMDREKTFTESDPPADDFLASVTVVWEDASKEVEQNGVNHISMRIGVILSPESGALLRLLLPFRMFVGGPFGSGEQYYSWIHIDDVIGAMYFLTQKSDAEDVYNLTAPNPVRNKEFSKTLGKVLNRPSWFPIPGFALELAFGDVSSVVLEGQQVLPKNLLEDGYEFEFEDLEKAFEDLL
jgi:uncharacterized protein (TIGR01777 family)